MILTINKMQLPVFIGVFPWEKQVKQTLTFDADLQIDFTRAVQSDALEDTIDYGAVQLCIEKCCDEQHFNLLERLASVLADRLVENFALTGLRLRVTKPHSLENTQSISIEVCRGSITT